MRTVPGVAIGIVKEVQAGQVKLEFPWLDQSYRTDWVDIAVPMSGGRRGMFLMPEREDEVLVAFDRGDFDHPYVVGCLWNGVDEPPETEIKNRILLTPGGHTLRFEDKDDAKKIVLKSSGGHQVVIDDASQAITVRDTNSDNQVVIDIQQGNIKIQAASKVIVEAQKIELIEGSVHPVVFGDLLRQYINSTLIPALQSHVHPGQMAVGVLPVTPAPPTVPFPQAPDTVNSTQVTTG